MGKNTKLVHFTIVDGNDKEIKALGIALHKLKDKLPLDIEFILTNDKIELHSVKYLIQELYKLYKRGEKSGRQSKKEEKG